MSKTGGFDNNGKINQIFTSITIVWYSNDTQQCSDGKPDPRGSCAWLIRSRTTSLVQPWGHRSSTFIVVITNLTCAHRQTIECNHPIEVVSYKIGVCKVSSKGKTCSTTFQLVGYNEKTNISVVLCFPHSGRMHQIRVHLQYLGNPDEVSLLISTALGISSCVGTA